jgi:type IV pilus assembly protein PilW
MRHLNSPQPVKNTAYFSPGFTIIELLIAVAVGLIVLGALCSTFIIQDKTYDVQEQVTEMIQSARGAVDMMTRDVQMAGYNPAGATFDGVTYSTSQLQIQADLNGDGDTGDTDENIIYTYDAANLRIDRNSETFADNIQAFAFEYLNSAGSATTTSSNIRQIRVTITSRTEKPDPNFGSNGGYRAFTLKTLITPKNLGI